MMIRKYKAMALALVILWAALTVGCGSWTGRRVQPVESPSGDLDAGSTKNARSGLNDHAKNEETWTPTTTTGSADLPAGKRESGIKLQDAGPLKERLRLNEERNVRWSAVGSLLASSGSSMPDGWPGCLELLQSMVSGYKRLLESSLMLPDGNTPPRTGADPFDPFVQEILFQENRCESIFDAAVRRGAERVPPQSLDMPPGHMTEDSPPSPKGISSSNPVEYNAVPVVLPALSEEQTARWEEGLKFLNLKRYDDAIVIFSLLQNTAIAEQAKAKLREASTMAATELRQQAAAAFAKARKTQGRTEQQALFLQSKQLLETILTRYPEAEIREKAVQNLKEVERQISAAPQGPPTGGSTENQPH